MNLWSIHMMSGASFGFEMGFRSRETAEQAFAHIASKFLRKSAMDKAMPICLTDDYGVSYVFDLFAYTMARLVDAEQSRQNNLKTKAIVKHYENKYPDEQSVGFKT